MEFNYIDIARELVKTLRKGKSAAEVSRLMGFKFNQVRRWDAGEKQLRWDEFCSYCEALGVPLLSALKNNYIYPSSDPRDFPGYLRREVYPYLSIEEIAERLHRHPSAMRRYLEGEVYPDLEFMLAFIHMDKMRLERIVLELLPADCRSDLRSRFENDLNHVEKILQKPILVAVKQWLNTNSYMELPAHDDAFLADRLGCSVDEVTHYLSELVKIGGARKDKSGKFIPLQLLTHTGTTNRRFYRDTQQHWFAEIARYYAGDIATRKGPVERIGSTRVFAATRKQAERINGILGRLYAEINGVLSEEDNSPKEDVRLVLFGSYSLQDIYADE